MPYSTSDCKIAAVSFINPLETLNDNDLYNEVETLYKADRQIPWILVLVLIKVKGFHILDSDAFYSQLCTYCT